MNDGQDRACADTGIGADVDAGTNGTSQIDMRRPKKPILSRRSSRRQFFAEARPTSFPTSPPHRPVQVKLAVPLPPPMQIGGAAADNDGGDETAAAADGSGGAGDDATAAATTTPKLVLSPRRAAAAAPAAVGFDTVGDGFVDALDTNRDGQVRCCLAV